MLTFPAPDPREGSRLAEVIEAATGKPATVVLDGETWLIDTDASEAAVRPIVEAHDGTPSPPADPDAEFRKAVEGSTTLAGLKAALLGATGPGAEPRRPDSR